jgi:BTB/POZ domain
MTDGSRWHLRVFPGGFSDRQAGFVSVEVVLLSVSRPEDSKEVLSPVPQEFNASFTIAILSVPQLYAQQPPVEPFTFKSPSSLTFRLDDESPQHRTWSIDNFIPSTELATKYLRNDAVTFAVEIEILGKPQTLSTTMPTPLTTLPTLSDDMSGILTYVEATPAGAVAGAGTATGTFSDIVLVCGPKKLRCHRCILAARSETFKRKLSNATFNAKLFFNGGQYFVDEVDPEVFEAVVKFIYTDTCR